MEEREWSLFNQTSMVVRRLGMRMTLSRRVFLLGLCLGIDWVRSERGLMQWNI